MDFFLRRKKKDKRRNTVAEGDTKELKNALQNIINDDQQRATMNGTLVKKPIAKAPTNKHLEQSNPKYNHMSDRRNGDCNKINQESSLRRYSGQSNGYLVNGHIGENGRAAMITKKPKSNLPISTTSAAMNVAVNMRQSNVERDERRCDIRHPSYLDYERKKLSDAAFLPENSLKLVAEDSGYSDSYKSLRTKTMDYSEAESYDSSQASSEIDVSSSSSSGATAMKYEDNSNATSLESDTLFIDSDESDSDSDFRQIDDSSSIVNGSNESVNSILSQTEIEMTASTATLTSIGFEDHNIPPAYSSSPGKKSESEPSEVKLTVEIDHEIRNSLSNGLSKPIKKTHNYNSEDKFNSKHKKPKHKKSKGSKNIFTNLVTKKHSESKSKQSNVGLIDKEIQPYFDIYQNNQIKKEAPITTFILENTEPLIDDKPKLPLKSFLPIRPEIKKDTARDVTKPLIREHAVPNKQSQPSINYESFKRTPPTKSVEVPLKYSHQVVVTPIQRHPSENNTLNNCRKSLFVDAKSPAVKSSNFPLNVNKMGEKAIAQNVMRPSRPTNLQARSKAAARVTLDYEGRIVYSSNSLNRSTPNDIINRHSTIKQNSYQSTNYFSLPNPNVNKGVAYYNSQVQPYNPNLQRLQNNSRIVSSMANSPLPHAQQSFKDLSIQTCQRFENFKPGCDSHIYENIPETVKNHKTVPHSSTDFPDISYISRDQETNIIYRNDVNIPLHSVYPENRENYNQMSLQCTNVIRRNNYVPENNFDQGFPEPPPPLPQAQMEFLSLESDNNLRNLNSCSNYDSPTPYLKNGEHLNQLQLTPVHESNHKSMNASDQQNSDAPVRNILKDFISPSTNVSIQDLLAALHTEKKRLGIKTESDISSSSGSNATTVLRHRSPNKNLAETGFLSPRYQRAEANNHHDRRSWSGFGTVDERPSLASDRRPLKPTSLFDFKMLLLQTRSNTQSPVERKSAVEMLRASPIRPTSDGASPLSQSQSSSPQNSPMSPVYVSQGHSTVPFRRHNARARQSLQVRYTTYPTIEEDCSEEAENNRDSARPDPTEQT